MHPNDTIAEATTLAAARLARQAGISVIPIRPDGSKAPVLTEVNPYLETPATDDEIDGGLNLLTLGLGLSAAKFPATWSS